MELKRILCLDLDGTVRRSKSGKTFIEGPDDVEIIPGMKELIWHYHRLGYIIIYVSNQAGVAHGFKTRDQVVDEIDMTMDLLSDEEDDMEFPPCFSWYICPYDNDGKVEEYKFRSLARKPQYGMLVQAEVDLVESDLWPDWDNSLFVGDRPEDQQCAQSAGIPFMWAEDFLKQQI